VWSQHVGMAAVMLLPRTCPICGRSGDAPCERCAAGLRRAPNLAVPPEVDVLLAVLAYDGDGRELVARLKYRNARSSLRWLASQMAAQVAAAGVRVDAVSWIPTTAARRRRRGFDHAELLARAVARRLGLPCRRLLDRRPGPPQTGRSATERRRGPTLVVRRGALPERVLLVDDVITTGATATAAARTLRCGGVGFVALSAAARTPPPGG
jgi:ComF family protein